MLINFFNPPLKLKFKKFHKTSTFNELMQHSLITSNKCNIVFLKSVVNGRLTLNHLEAARKVVRRKLRKLGVFKAHVHPYVCTTHKALAVRMGKGKGAVDNWVFPVRPGRILFEISSVPVKLGREALLMAAKKLPIRSKVFAF